MHVGDDGLLAAMRERGGDLESASVSLDLEHESLGSVWAPCKVRMQVIDAEGPVFIEETTYEYADVRGIVLPVRVSKSFQDRGDAVVFLSIRLEEFRFDEEVELPPWVKSG